MPPRDAPDAGNAPVLSTGRLALRHLTLDDAPFIVELLNDPGWLRFIGDRNVRTPDDARRYLAAGPLAMYASAGFGLYLAELRSTRTPIGMCGLIRRAGLDDVDIGFALLPAFRGAGYAQEAAMATLAFARERLGLPRVVAIVSPDNEDSIRLLERIGLRFTRRMAWQPGDDVLLYAIDFA